MPLNAGYGMLIHTKSRRTNIIIYPYQQTETPVQGIQMLSYSIELFNYKCSTGCKDTENKGDRKETKGKTQRVDHYLYAEID